MFIPSRPHTVLSSSVRAAASGRSAGECFAEFEAAQWQISACVQFGALYRLLAHTIRDHAVVTLRGQSGVTALLRSSQPGWIMTLHLDGSSFTLDHHPLGAIRSFWPSLWSEPDGHGPVWSQLPQAAREAVSGTLRGEVRDYASAFMDVRTGVTALSADMLVAALVRWAGPADVVLSGAFVGRLAVTRGALPVPAVQTLDGRPWHDPHWDHLSIAFRTCSAREFNADPSRLG